MKFPSDTYDLNIFVEMYLIADKSVLSVHTFWFRRRSNVISGNNGKTRIKLNVSQNFEFK